MMFISLIQKRRSIRKYVQKKVEPEKIDRLVEAAVRAPSSMGSNPWEFIVVEDQDMLAQLSQAKQHGSSFVKGAALAFVICADPEKSQVWVEDAAIATIFIQLAAESMGLGSCWVQIRKRMHDETKTAEEYISDLLNIPEGKRVVSMMAVGYPDEEKAPHGEASLQYEKVHLGSYGRPYK